NFYRYLSHFRSVHRGAFFSEIKMTSVRKLLPEAWGFLCPVHTPDGIPCGLLNHLSHICQVQTQVPYTQELPRLLRELGMVEMIRYAIYPVDMLPIFLDGQLMGKGSAAILGNAATRLRYEKIRGSDKVPAVLEIAHVPPSNGGQYPGLYLFTSPARMLRPVK